MTSSEPHPDFDLPGIARAIMDTCPDVEVTPDDLVLLPAKGVSHDHFLIGKSGFVLRVPRLSQMGLSTEINLAYQTACFRRAEASGETPRYKATLSAESALPNGGLVVEAIEGRVPSLPRDCAAIATALARIHGLPLPSDSDRPPLQNHERPLADTLAVIEGNLPYMDSVALAPAARRALEEERRSLMELAATTLPPHPTTLVMTDTHPGNFLITRDGRAVAVDLEKALYGSAAIDLAHASLPTSTVWDPDVTGDMSPEDVSAFYERWIEVAGRELAEALEFWFIPMRRLTWLRTTLFLMKWTVESAGRGDWSSARLGASAADHFRRHAEACLNEQRIDEIRSGWLVP